MPIRSGDIKLLASQVMDDVPEGGGAPTANVIPDGVSNALFPDISESARAGGRLYIRQVSAAVQTNDRDVYMDANLIVAEPPNDPNISITLMKAPGVFARRTEVANAIESYLVQGSVWGGYLLENHVAGQRTIQLLQRPGSPQPPIGRTLALVQSEGLPGEQIQFVRSTRVESERRTFTEIVQGIPTDFAADVVTVQISDKLRTAFAGSPPSRLFASAANKTIVRDTTVADAGNYYGVVPLQIAADIGDAQLKATSVYTQLVPNARTEAIALDQRPAAVRELLLATAPRRVSVASSPHTMRIKIGQENRGFGVVQILKPLPAPGTVAVSYRALGSWYSVVDDGQGGLTGSGVGTVNYATGSIACTFPVLPDVGSSVIFGWGESSAFVSRSGQAGFRAPEFGIKLEHDGVQPGTLVLQYTSAGVLKTVTDTAGALAGNGTGEINYAAGMLLLRPSAMPDPGTEFSISYKYGTLVTKPVTVVPDAGGFATIALDDVPAAGSVAVRWTTVRNVSNSSGATSGGNTSKTGNSTTTTVLTPPGATGPVVTPVSMTRVPISAGAGTSGNEAYMAGMFPGGTRLLTGETQYMGVFPTAGATGYYYDVPDVTGVQWSEQERASTKNIGGTEYRAWGISQPVSVSGG
ncbi:hypothetical protein [Xylophilus ampelinus]|uniref:Uncharacterized protein n=1 Tax=Xylophilus ampelinus TaxID=54067 RepID=A0A318SQX8_9BURK|nr:hypothetical protein [Xylophilus ampelinus]MCS4509133.1 hypothetical protein [Xylophilus ampelinus]PYE79839.1 hypothetical protein DFQ15_101159 [Xylophilus ampelinus]